MLCRLKCYLVIPVSHKYKPHKLSSCSHQLVAAAIKQAEGFFRLPVMPIGVIRRSGECIHLYTRKHMNIRAFYGRGTYLFMNVGFLASDSPPIEQLIQDAGQGKWAWSGQASSDSVHAMAFRVKGFLKKTSSVSSMDRLSGALLRLTTCSNESLSETDAGQSSSFENEFIAPNVAGIDHSPAMENILDAKRRPTAFDPRFLNTAFMEIVSKPVASNVGPLDSDDFAHALLKYRDRSTVPWIFNAMVNEIEYRKGSTSPEAFPPEVHLSTTGMCNINCRFCGYEQSIARPNCVRPEQIQKMTYLRHSQTLRLSSGLGEPSLNPYLPEIINFISESFPHIQMGFFSNGIALNGNKLLDAIVGNVNWIHISLNAASPESYREQCRMDGFDRIASNLSHLHSAKRDRRNLMPLAMGSMVLNRKNLFDLPKMPTLCRKLGIDRLTIFPFFALGSHDPAKFGPDDTLAACMPRYGPLYEETIKTAEQNRVTLEIPAPDSHSGSSFGMPTRSFYDFAQIESNEWPLGRFLTGLKFDVPEGSYCHFLWRYAAIGNTNNTGHSPHETHFLYPCIGPLSSVDLSRRTAFRFKDEKGFLKLWQHTVLTLLRKAQHSPGICEVCDLCRNNNVRDPAQFRSLEEQTARFVETHRKI
jgi:sulfatase maturation enzyme AslB (radical SAM superfamily)